ncbi:hypothetical protein E8E12_009775 [Didymella heteroderae]|uniref:RING-type domain-containing protein n=1 Tax=Didymella heteroderae TaxID=1769908 RepID=A0A9P4WUC9_9PLEO|nr:hypothetical protein E8E12_009775 [Didymella heteroderae]
MFDFTSEDWVAHLESWYSFDRHLWLHNPSDPYYKAMQKFQKFTDRIITALRRDDDTSWALIQYDQLQNIYDGLPRFRTEAKEKSFRTWIKGATLKHPERRTAKQYQWLFIVDLQVATPTGDIALMVLQAIHCLTMWENRALGVDNLSVDPDDTEYFFRNKHAVKDVVGKQSGLGEPCGICTNDFDTGSHRPQQGPCGHIYCHECFKNTLAHALKPPEAKYTCAFCRSCLVCGASSCEDHISTHEKVPPYPLGVLLSDPHLLCTPEEDYCAADEMLYGLSPKRYWAFREQSRELRSSLSAQLYILNHALDPNHESRAKAEVDQSLKQLKDMAIEGRKLTLQDLEMERLAAAFIGKDDSLD